MDDSLITTIVGVGEECFPSWLESFAVNVVSVILWSNVAFSGLMIEDWNILSAVSEWKFLGLSTGGKSHELISQADTENGFDFAFETCDNLFEFLDGEIAHGWITWSVG